MADLVLLNGKIMTMDDAQPSVEAVAIANDRVIAVGTNVQLKKYIRDETQIVDLDGKFAMPGLIEGHAHFLGLGRSMMMLNLSKADSWEEIVASGRRSRQSGSPGAMDRRSRMASVKMVAATNAQRSRLSIIRVHQPTDSESSCVADACQRTYEFC